MNVHNMMEDMVSAEVETLYEQVSKAKPAWLTCSCKNCRLDTISYVLNRVQPKYVVSGRGVTHSHEIFADHQLIADISALAMEGIRIISSTKRPFHNLPREECEVKEEFDPNFNFPTFSGVILDGNTFEPVSGATVTLKLNGKKAEMVDMTWSNPVNTFNSTKGTFIFWVNSQPAEKEKVSKNFEFEIDVEAKGYEKAIHYFDVPIISDSKRISRLNSACSIKIRDIVLFKREFAEEDEEKEENSSK